MASLKKLLALSLTPAYWPALLKRVAPTVEHRKHLARHKFATVLDVGANKGQFAYFAATQWPRADLQCFEPLPQPASQLKNLLGNRITLHECALGAQAGSADMHVASRTDSSSLLALGETQKEMFQMDEVGRHTVPVQRLDTVISQPVHRPSLLKIDVQGFEYETLEGAAGILSDIDVVYVEASFVELYKGQRLADDVINLLQAHGFTLTATHNEQRDAQGRRVQADLLFEQTHTSDQHSDNQ